MARKKNDFTAPLSAKCFGPLQTFAPVQKKEETKKEKKISTKGQKKFSLPKMDKWTSSL
jgi:hypothetical protein